MVLGINIITLEDVHSLHLNKHFKKKNTKKHDFSKSLILSVNVITKLNLAAVIVQKVKNLIVCN
jgi:hypothetical protein